jgi:hypothetical protein
VRVTTTPALDPVSVFVGIAAWLFSPAVAAVLGPYTVILIGATLGAFWSLGDRKKSGRASGLGYFVGVNAAAVLFTVGCTKVVKALVPGLATTEDSWLYGPVATVIAAFGPDGLRLAAKLGPLWLRARLGMNKGGGSQ